MIRIIVSAAGEGSGARPQAAKSTLSMATHDLPHTGRS
jgi:hypothetical protein